MSRIPRPRTPAELFGAAVIALLAVAVGSITIALSQPRDQPEWASLSFGEARSFAAVVPLRSGELLVVGGMDREHPGVMRRTSELLDPRSGRVRVLPQRLEGRIHHTATLATDGHVVVAGGTKLTSGGWQPIYNTDVYEPFSRTWTAARALHEERSDHSAVALPGGRVMIAGGNRGVLMLSSVEIYDRASNTWRLAAPMPLARTRFSMATLRDGRVLVAGGIEEGGAPSRTSFLYDPDRDRWTEGPALRVARLIHATAQLPNGDVLLIGGQRDGAPSAERYDHARNRFVDAGRLREGRMGAQAVVLPDGRVLVTGGLPPAGSGYTGWHPRTVTEVWDPATNAWSAVADAPNPRAFGVLVVSRGAVYQASGTVDGERAVAVVDRLIWK